MSNYPSGIDWSRSGRGFVDVTCPNCGTVTTLETWSEPWSTEYVGDPECQDCGADLSEVEAEPAEPPEPDYEGMDR